MIQSREERRQELNRIARGPKGLDRLQLLMKVEAVPLSRQPTKATMIEALLDHDDAKWTHSSAQPGNVIAS
jgi:hypothetical protein